MKLFHIKNTDPYASRTNLSTAVVRAEDADAAKKLVVNAYGADINNPDALTATPLESDTSAILAAYFPS